VPLLELRQVETLAQGSGIQLAGIDLKIMPGELVGVAGISGSGQKELGDLILGLHRPAGGIKLLFNKDATRWPVAKVRASGVAFVPEDPLAMAAVPWMTVRENMALGYTWEYALQGGLSMNWLAVQRDAERSFARLGLDVPPYFAPISTLSGGNLQRAILARELAHKPKLILAFYPTRGLDVPSANAVRRELLEVRNSGGGILLISEDLGELFAYSDRLLILYQGRIVGQFKPQDISMTEVGHLMTGSKAHHD
jgi:general nucleoside transport system ATP-binding protein